MDAASNPTTRDRGVAGLIDAVRAATAGVQLDRAVLAQVLLPLQDLAAHRSLWSAADFPDPPEGAQQRRYLVHEEPDQSLALYLMVMRKGKRTPVHDHQTWACIAAVEGAETNELYRCLQRNPATGVGVVEPAGTRIVRPGEGLSFLPDDVHAVSIEQDELIRHLHLYGRALETLHDRVVFHPEQQRCEPMFIHVPTLRRAGTGAWQALGDRVVDGRRWSYVDTQHGDEVLLMLPGAMGSCRSFDPMLDALARRYRVIALSYPAVDDVPTLAAGALGVLQAAGVARATVFGSSLGGFVAQWMALLEPARVERLVLANSFDDPRPAQDAAELQRVQAMSDDAFRQATLQRLQATPDERFRQRMLPLVLPQPAASLRSRRIAVLQAAPLPAFAREAATVTLVDAEDDPVLPAVMRDGLAARYPGAVHRRFATGGHHLHITREAELAALLLSMPGAHA